MNPYLENCKIGENFYHKKDTGGFLDKFQTEYLHFFFGVTHPKNTSLKCSMDECVNRKAVALKEKSPKLLLHDFGTMKYEFFDYENFDWVENWHKIVTTSFHNIVFSMRFFNFYLMLKFSFSYQSQFRILAFLKILNF